MSNFLDVAVQAARSGGDVLRQWQGRFAAKEKAPRDLVTEADLASQQEIQRIVDSAFPEHGFLGEEDAGSTINSDSPFRWIVDPLDGTTNYVHGLPLFCVSVALERAGDVIAAAIYDPTRDECYRAELGQGAFLENQPLRVSDCRELGEAMGAASFSAHVPRESPEISRFFEMLSSCRALRRLGSAALNMCFVASGQLDFYFATSAKIWDIAAGCLIVREAGGTISQLDGSPLDLENPKFAATASPQLHRQVLDVLSKA